jgi:anti-sigma factor RsiW
MNMSNEERFHELAHKALSKEAQVAERAELQTLIAENPKLKEEFEQMGAESAAAREILPQASAARYAPGTAGPAGA